MEFRNRIKKLTEISGKKLRENPLNFRKHPNKQKSFLSLLLEKIGWVTGVIVYEDPEYGLTLVDGHLRADIADDDIVPCILTDLTREEAKEVLYSFDYITALAQEAEEKRKELEEEIGYTREDLASVARDVQEMVKAEVSEMVPLAIVLSSSEYQEFQQAKLRLGVQQDKAALMRMCEVVNA